MLRQKRKAPLLTVMIRMLDGSDREFPMQRCDTPESLILNVATSLDLSDRALFGLAYPWSENQSSSSDSSSDFNAWVWLNNHKPLLKQLSDLNQYSTNSVSVVYFRFKFYPRPPIVTTVQDDKIRHLLRLQIEQDFRDGHLDCSFHMRAYMDAYLMQAELGNYDSSLHNSLDYVRVIRGLDSRFDGVEMLQWIASYHSELDGVTAAEAEAKYLSLAARLPDYGVTSFPVSSVSGHDLVLNIGMDGIFISNNSVRGEQYHWLQIISLSYRRRKVRLEVQSQYKDDSKIRPSIIEYKCNSERNAKLIWLTCMDFHMFYRPKALNADNSKSKVSTLNTKGTRRFLSRTVSLRRSLSARRHYYTTGHVLRSDRRSQSESLSVDESGNNIGSNSADTSAELSLRRFSEPTGPQQPSTSMGAGTSARLHHSSESLRMFGGGSGDGTTASSTPATGHKTLNQPCEMCGWSAAWTRGVSPQLYNEDSLSLLPRKCEFRIIRLGAAKLGWSVDGEASWGMPMIGFTASGRRLYSITEDGREYLLEGWSASEGDRLICTIDVRRRFASWYLNDVLIETRSDLPVVLTRGDAQPTVWDNEADLEISLSRGNNGTALTLIVRASSSARHKSEITANASVRPMQASRASSATSSDSPVERCITGLTNSRLPSIEHDDCVQNLSVETRLNQQENLIKRTIEKELINDTEEDVEEGTSEDDVVETTDSAKLAAKVENNRLEEGVTVGFMRVNDFPFVETHTTRIPSVSPSGLQPSSQEKLVSKVPFVKTRRCIFQG